MFNRPIPLDPSFINVHGREQTESELRRIVCSIRFELMEQESAVRLHGPDMSYHQADPYLAEYLRKVGLVRNDVISYVSSVKRVDTCFEDSWTGYFIAKRFTGRPQCDDLTLIHLDDHADMMATLLGCSYEGLTDPTSSAVFDPTCSESWRSAIFSGAISIGNYLTPLYYSGSRVHIRHINNSPDGSELCHILQDRCRYDLIPDRQFATLAKRNWPTPESRGTYLAVPCPEAALDQGLADWTIVHIDLDYFINDFNGASRGADYIPDPVLRVKAAEKLDRFFAALMNVRPNVDRWIIAKSPGFCSAYHWDWLLSTIRQKISEYDGDAV